MLGFTGNNCRTPAAQDRTQQNWVEMLAGAYYKYIQWSQKAFACRNDYIQDNRRDSSHLLLDLCSVREAPKGFRDKPPGGTTNPCTYVDVSNGERRSCHAAQAVNVRANMTTDTEVQDLERRTIGCPYSMH